ncbi:DUF3592 domain-containing protein [Marinitenerispora sediminis]|uniref:DUF3592 domain-containing protein n=1 Tax=Marinitenerispora sediminis TaxID=1931232 RepID=A0A368TAK4_9ACTN|nr:DUF3592 domain-containing protein [Marinitenerispora sediminis]RCV55878.1 DUF3592 domain-containing protein [Marinitenerispora sediminis]RCV61999.1 DUF3592 domain-containing protein [Marinitenerispora sediminis]RCV62008.1 DUF3592 domain-containing protein [Marinitenerispora sediminis]
MVVLYPLLPLGIGVLVLGWLLYTAWRSAVLAERGERAPAEVVGYREGSGSSRMVVRFRTGDGREVLAAHDSTGWTAARAGDIVTVAYDPARPDRARVVDAPWLSRGVPMLLGALGACFVVIGALLGLLAWR